MVKDDIVVGGEESGGLRKRSYSRTRWDLDRLIIWEFMANPGKTLDDLIEEVYELVDH